MTCYCNECQEKRNKISIRGKNWEVFSQLVAEHIEDYTVPQYGDYPHDQLTEFTIQEVVMNMKRYLNRAETSQRGDEDKLRDCFKLAHYANVLYDLHKEEIFKKGDPR